MSGWAHLKLDSALPRQVLRAQGLGVISRPGVDEVMSNFEQRAYSNWAEKVFCVKRQ